MAIAERRSDFELWRRREAFDAREGARLLESFSARGVDGAMRPNSQVVLDVLHNMIARGGPGRVIAQDQGIHLGPRQLGHPQNWARSTGMADGAFVSRDGRYGINLEVENLGSTARSRAQVQEELTKHAQAMRTARGRPPTAPTRGGSAPAGRITDQDIRRTATVLVETDPRTNAIRRIRHQTFRVAGGRVTPRVVTVFNAGPRSRGISASTASRRGLLDRVRTRFDELDEYDSLGPPRRQRYPFQALTSVDAW